MRIENSNSLIYKNMRDYNKSGFGKKHLEIEGKQRKEEPENNMKTKDVKSTKVIKNADGTRTLVVMQNSKVVASFSLGKPMNVLEEGQEVNNNQDKVQNETSQIESNFGEMMQGNIAF